MTAEKKPEVRDDETDSFFIPVSCSLERHLGWLYGPGMAVFFWLRIHAIERGDRRGQVEASVREVAAGIQKSIGLAHAGLATLVEHGWLERMSSSDGWSGKTVWRIVRFKSMESFRRLRQYPVQPAIHPRSAGNTGCSAGDTGCSAGRTERSAGRTGTIDRAREEDDLRTICKTITRKDSPPSPSPKKERRDNSQRADVADVFEHFKKVTGSESRLKVWAPKIAARLKTFTPEQIKSAIDKCAADTWWREHQKILRDPEQFFGSDIRIDKKLSAGNAKPSNGNRNSRGTAPAVHLPYQANQINDRPCACPFIAGLKLMEHHMKPGHCADCGGLLPKREPVKEAAPCLT